VLLHWIQSEEFITLIKNPQVIAIFLAILLEISRRTIQPKASIIWGVGHGFAFSLPNSTSKKISLFTKSVYVRNIGRAPAKEIEIYFNYPPYHFQIWPSIQYTAEKTAEENFVLKIPFLKQGESFAIEMVQTDIVPPELLNVRAIEGTCKNVEMSPQRIFPPYLSALGAIILIIGTYQLLVWLILLLLWLIHFV
jgi:hypothetical protein